MTVSRRLALSRAILTAILASSAILSFLLDWSPNHLLNPLWHPHARFHGALLLFLLAGVCGSGIWMMWRQSGEPQAALRLAGFLSLSFWTPLFYITTLLPESTSWAGNASQDPRLTGSIVTPNLIVAVGFVLLTVVAIRLTFTPLSAQQSSKSIR